jgi:hypothetical protein
VATYRRKKRSASGKRASSTKKRVTRKHRKVSAAEKKRRSLAATKGWKTRKASEKAKARSRRKGQKKAKATRARRKKKATPSRKRKTKRELVRELRRLDQKIEKLLKERQKKAKPKRELEAEKKDLEAEKRKAQAEASVTQGTRKTHPSPDELARIRAEAEERIKRDFRGIINQAEKEGIIPTPPLGEIEELDGHKTYRSRVNVPIGIELDESEIDSIVATVRAAAEQLEPRKGWYATVALSGFGRRVVGSGGWKQLPSDDLAERGIQAEAYSSTGAHSTMESMLSRLYTVLEELADEDATILVRYVTVTTFDRKSPEEQAEWRREQE